MSTTRNDRRGSSSFDLKLEEGEVEAASGIGLNSSKTENGGRRVSSSPRAQGLSIKDIREEYGIYKVPIDFQ